MSSFTNGDIINGKCEGRYVTTQFQVATWPGGSVPDSKLEVLGLIPNRGTELCPLARSINSPKYWVIIEPHHEKTVFLHMRKQSGRSAVQ